MVGLPVCCLCWASGWLFTFEKAQKLRVGRSKWGAAPSTYAPLFSLGLLEKAENPLGSKTVTIPPPVGATFPNKWYTYSNFDTAAAYADAYEWIFGAGSRVCSDL